MQIGRYEISPVSDGSFCLDGGAMFGIVPRPLWECHLAPDQRHRVNLALRCLLLRDRVDGRVLLIDTGMGTRWTERERRIYGIQQEQTDLLRSLAEHGIAPDQVTDVVVSHLHFDHAGGLSAPADEGQASAVFPKATLHVQRSNWAWANAPTPRDQGSYRADDFGVHGPDRLNLLDGDVELCPGLRVEAGNGHTTGHQTVWIEDDNTTLVYAGDLVPTQAHIKLAWGMSYDLRPLDCMKEKRDLLSRLEACRGILVFDHDPTVDAVTLGREGDKIVAADTLSL